ncbi:Muscarinic acetylcholine receptor gar-3, variant 3 [Parelaphostrongylus tenuis]|uniref:Muscarinic acetylcholine receptor gar-3, variant 3 n=1 Tax=Parelaphostrongylus tenuis TaxID=148309 RepID=A0AAD5RDF0_PARTN|nr:Muscarinic acetylcholine receptor gar-3, variant 3 [Parelaphostrongylus tenuis]
MARPKGLSAPLDKPDSSVVVPFRNTELFHVVMEVLSSSMENATSSDPDSVSASEFLYGNESRLVAIIVVGAVFAIVTIIGNLMVMVSFKIDKQLQTISNYFLFSLAMADIAIGMISIPLWTYYTAMRTWGIGYTMCQFWLCVDYLMCNASVLNLLLISFDRYFSVTRPLSYRPRRTTRKALVMIACTYIISMILWPPWIISWPYIEDITVCGLPKRAYTLICSVRLDHSRVVALHNKGLTDWYHPEWTRTQFRESVSLHKSLYRWIMPLLIL